MGIFFYNFAALIIGFYLALKSVFSIGWLLLLAALLVACSSSDDGVGETVVPDVEQESAEKAIVMSQHELVETRSTSELSALYDAFLVKGIKTKTATDKQIVFDKYTVKHSDGSWYYEGIGGQFLKYWDFSAKSYTFAAVSPVPNNAADATFAWKETTVSISDNGEISINGIKGNISHDNSLNSAGAPDWMVARTVRRDINEASKLLDYDDLAEDIDAIDLKDPAVSDVFPKPSVAYADVPLRFHHIFADVEFKAYATSNVSVTSFKVMIPDDNADQILNQANYNTSEGWTGKTAETNFYQDPKRFGSYDYEPSRTIGTTPETAITLARHVQIPQEFLADGRTFKITIQTDEGKEGKTYTGIITLNADNNDTNSWEQNKHYTYILKIDIDSGDNPVILFAVDLETWKWIEGNSTEDTQTNW